MRTRRMFSLVIAALVGAAITSCNSNDDQGTSDIEIPGITLDNDDECCAPSEALQVYTFLRTLKHIPELSTVVDDQYNVFAYTKTGGFHVGYNEIFFVATKKKNGNYVKEFSLSGITPLMLMTKMNMTHSTPVSFGASRFDESIPAVQRAWISFVMSSSDAGFWSLRYDAQVLGKSGGIHDVGITVDELADGQNWLKSFKYADRTYYLTLVDPTSWKTGSNTIQAYVSVKSADGKQPYELSAERFTIDIDPRMPDMGNHTSPDNTPLVLQHNGIYEGIINLTMTGLWRIHLRVKDSKGNVVAGGDETSSLYWDVTL